MSVRIKGQYPGRLEGRPRIAVLVVILVVFLMTAVEGWSLDAVAAVIATVAAAATVPAVVAATGGARTAE